MNSPSYDGIFYIKSVANRVGCLFRDTALPRVSVFPAVSAQSKISMFTPMLAPAIFELPIFLAIFLAISDNQNSVIQVGPAVFGKYSMLVELQAFICLNSNTHRSMGYSSLEFRFRTWRNLVEGLNGVWTFAGLRIRLEFIPQTQSVVIFHMLEHFPHGSALARVTHAFSDLVDRKAIYLVLVLYLAPALNRSHGAPDIAISTP